jgi:hypothetical protein
MLEDVAGEYCIPMTSGRGFCSYPPRRNMRDRFLASGKERLVVIIFADFDPAGEEIAHSFGRSMRDDFGVTKITPIKAALTFDQVTVMNLPSSIDPKRTDANYNRFASKYGTDQHAFELEALEPGQLKKIARHTIDAVLDRELFNKELAQEKEDSAHIQGLRCELSKLLVKFAKPAS